MPNKKNKNDDVIIEAEIIDEKPKSKPSSSGTTTQASVSTSDSPSPKNTTARIGWGIALLLLAFVGGIFMEPLAEQGLKRLGILKEQPAKSLVNSGLDPVIAAQKQQQEKIAQIETAFKMQSAALASLTQENDSLKRDITTLASGLPEGEDAALSSKILSDINGRISQVEAMIHDTKSSALKNQTDASVTERHESELKLARAETAQLLERLLSFEKSFELSQSKKLSDSTEGRAAVTLHHLYINATAGANYSADIAALKPDLVNLPLLNLQPVGQALATLQANQEGIATHNEITREFTALIPALLKVSVAEESTGWLASFFTLRRTDARAEGVEAVIRTIESHLANRDLTAAYAAADTFPDPVKAITKDWQSKLLARNATLSALTNLLTTLAGDK